LSIDSAQGENKSSDAGQDNGDSSSSGKNYFLFLCVEIIFFPLGDQGPNKTIVYIILGILFSGLLFFIYNFYRCSKKKHHDLEDDLEDLRMLEMRKQRV
jgi:uncharacterized membrane protein YuzA (DUF378 family)